ncbi:MAG: hypothetical protein K6E97_00285 [Treponema sp.]|nr:hypothetical protein [Treponema sp.]
MLKKINICLLCSVVLFFAGCSSLSVESDNTERPKPETFAEIAAGYGPDSYALIYCNHSSYELYQQNPKIGYKMYHSKSTGTVLFSTYYCGYVGPVPVGSEFAIVETTYSGSNSLIFEYIHGIQGVDFVITKPGLYYLDFFDKKHKKELAATRYLLEVVQGTEWEIVVQKRIEELENAKK